MDILTTNTVEMTVPLMSATEEKTKITLKIGTYNIAAGRNTDYDMNVIAKDILSRNLDVVGIQEADRFCLRSNYIDTMKLLSEYTGYEYYTFTKAVSLEGNAAVYGEGGSYGTGILSKYPVSDYKSVNLSSGTYEQRAVGYVNITVEGHTFAFFNTHLSYEDKETRTKQFEELDELIGDRTHFILTADFNTADLTEFTCFENADTVQHREKFVTFPSKGTGIDNIVYSKSFEYVTAGVTLVAHSDHRLLWAEFSWNPEK